MALDTNMLICLLRRFVVYMAKKTVNIALRGKNKGTVKHMTTKEFNDMVCSNLEASFELEGIKTSARNKAKIKNASKHLDGII